MNNKMIFGILGVLIIAGVAIYLIGGNTSDIPPLSLKTEEVTPPVSEAVAPLVNTKSTSSSIKEFAMTSWMEKKTDGTMSPHFSLAEMSVKKGDRVRITITNTAGTHNFMLDEFNVKQETPLNEPVVVEFVADKVGTFEYYCGKYDHRALGQKGTLIVSE